MLLYIFFYKYINQVCKLSEEAHQSTQLQAQAATTFNKTILNLGDC